MSPIQRAVDEIVNRKEVKECIVAALPTSRKEKEKGYSSRKGTIPFSEE